MASIFMCLPWVSLPATLHGTADIHSQDDVARSKTPSCSFCEDSADMMRCYSFLAPVACLALVVRARRVDAAKVRFF